MPPDQCDDRKRERSWCVVRPAIPPFHSREAAARSKSKLPRRNVPIRCALCCLSGGSMSTPHAVRRRGAAVSDAPPAAVSPCPLRAGSTPALALLAGRPLVPDLAERLLTGCLHDPAPPRTYPVLITRTRPKRCAAQYHAWWRELAPSLALLHTATPEDSRRDGFARAYRAELNALPLRAWYRALLHLAEWLHTYPTVTLLSYERVPALLERQIVTQRSVLRAWLLSAPRPQQSTSEEGVR